MQIRKISTYLVWMVFSFFSIGSNAQSQKKDKIYDCIQIGEFIPSRSGFEKLDSKVEDRLLLTYVKGEKDFTMSMSGRNIAPIPMNLGIVDFGKNTTNIQGQAQTILRTYNLTEPIRVRIVDNVYAGSRRLIVIDVGTEKYIGKFKEYLYRFSCFDE